MRVDLPLPETPVIKVKTPIGIFTETFLRLFELASLILIYFFDILLFCGIGIDNSPDKYLPVIEFLFFLISSGVPIAVISPP